MLLNVLAPNSTAARGLGKAFESYKPPGHKVYGSVCTTPENKVLLVKGRRSGKFSFPKGHKKGGESYLDCARRETFEETGLDISSLESVGYGTLQAGEYFFFELEEMELEPHDTWEVEEALWVPVEESSSLPCNVDVNLFLVRMGMRRSRVKPSLPPSPALDPVTVD